MSKCRLDDYRRDVKRFLRVLAGLGWFRGRHEPHTSRATRGINVPTDKPDVTDRSTNRRGVVRNIAGVNALASDAEFGAASALDFTRFDIELDAERCVATVEVMGASFVSIALPPIRSYVRLHGDQREALVACLSALEWLVS